MLAGKLNNIAIILSMLPLKRRFSRIVRRTTQNLRHAENHVTQIQNNLDFPSDLLAEINIVDSPNKP